jgi:two-component system sensor kinase FixL
MMALGRPIGGTPFFIVVEFPDQLFASQARYFLRRIAMIDLVLLALGLMVAWSLSRSITRPLNLLTGSASKISNGDYSGLVNIRGNDELRALGNAFNSMVAKQQASQRDREQKIHELKLMQEAASKVAKIVEFSHDAIVGKTLDGTVTTWNDGAEKLYGYSAAEVVGRSIAILAPPEHADEAAAILARLTQGDKIDHFETEHITKEGKQIFVSLSISPIRDESGAISGWSTIARDITKRKDAEEALQTSETRYRRLFESAKDGILILEADSGQIIDVNPYLLKMLGYSKEDLTGKQLWEIGPFKDIVASKLAFAELKERGYIRYENLPLESRKGVIRQVEVFSNSYLAGKTRVIQCNIRDITERKLAEAALSASQGRYYTLFEYAPDGIVIADRQSYYVDANASMCRMLGYRRDELIGLHASDIVTQSETPHIGSALGVLKAKSDHHREWQFRRKEGSVFAAEVIATMMPDGNLMGMVRDITERKLAEEELRQTNQSLGGALAELQTKTDELTSMTQQLWQASKLATMGELAASIAHELNNPLATISLRAELLVGELAIEDPNRESLLVIEQEVERMSALVSNLLLFSRRSHQQISTVNIVEELKNSLQFLNYHLRSHGIDVATDFENDLPNIHADTQQLRQVFLNLLTNASDAMPYGGTLTVRAKQQALETGARVVVLEFSDSGVGVEPEDLPKLWEPFFTTKPEGKGTGLGLPICRRAVEEHRGTIDIESLPGKGTTVRIILPATETEIR